MAKLPTVADLGGRYIPSPSTGVRGLRGGEAVGQAVAQAGKVVGQIGDMIGDREATAAAKERDTYIADQLRDLIYNPETGFANQKGRSALDQQAALDEALTKLQDEAMSGLNQMAGDKLSPQLARRMEGARDTVARHTSQQRDVWIEGASEARILSAQQDAIVDPSMTAASLATIEGEVVAWQARNGKTAEEGQLELQRRTSGLYVEQIETLSADDPEAAYEYFKEQKDKIAPNVVNDLEPRLKSEAATSRGRRRGSEAYEAWSSGRSPTSPSTPGSTAGRIVAAGAGYTTIEMADGTVVRREGTRAWRNNNPGNIEYGEFARSQGAVGSDGRFAVFPTYEEGRAAKRSLLFESSSYKNLSIEDAINRYAPPTENNTNRYTAAVAAAAGVPAGTPMSSLSPLQRNMVLDAMEAVEGFKPGSETTADGGTVQASAQQTDFAGEVGSAEDVEMMLRDIEDPDEMAAAVREFSARVGLERQNSTAQKNETVQAALDAIWKQGTRPEDLPLEMQRTLKENGLWESIGTEYIAKANGVQQYNDAAWLQENYYSLPPDERLQVDLAGLKEHMNYETWSAEATARAKGTSVGPSRTTNDVIKNQLAEFEIDVNNDTDEDNRNRVRAFWGNYDQSVAEFTREKGRAPNDREAQELVKDVTASWDLMFVDTLGPFNKVTAGAAFEVMTPDNLAALGKRLDVPATDVALAIAFMQDRGMAMDEDTLEAVLAAGA